MSAKRGFTLGEVVVVVICLGILAVVLIPVLFQARLTPRRSSCKNNLRQIGIALHLYADDFDNAFPTVEDVPPEFDTEPGHTVQALQLLYTLNYTDNPKIFSCPSTPSSYNDFKPGSTLKATSTSYAYDPRHSSSHAGPVIVAGDCQDGTKPVSANHGGDGGNYLAIDSSVQWIKKPNNVGDPVIVDATVDPDGIYVLGPPGYLHDSCLRRTTRW
jgi:type II secretory pathway pseudopilin PulG